MVIQLSFIFRNFSKISASQYLKRIPDSYHINVQVSAQKQWKKAAEDPKAYHLSKLADAQAK